MAGLRSQLSAADRYQDTVAELTGVNEALTTQRDELQMSVVALRQERNAAQARVVELNESLTAASDRQAALEAQVATLGDLPQQLSTLQSEMTALRARHDSLSRENDALAERLATAETAAESNLAAATVEWQADRATLQAEVERLRGESSDLALSLASERERLAAEATATAQAREEILTLQSRLETLTAQAGDLQDISRRLAAAEQDGVTQRQANLRLQEALATAQRDAQSEATTLRRENSALNARLRQAQNTLDQIASAARVLQGGTSASVPSAQRPEPATPAGAARTHVVVEGDSLTRISLRYYGTPTRWQDIYQANRELLSEANALRPGQQLRIP